MKEKWEETTHSEGIISLFLETFKGRCHKFMWLLRGEGMAKQGDGLYTSIVLHDYNVKSQGNVPGKGKSVPLEKSII